MIHTVPLDYNPREWQRSIHRSFRDRRFGIAICHRRAGKSVAARMELMHRALSTPKFEGAYIAPFLSQARRVFWNPLRDLSMRIPHVECRETDMLVTYPNKSTIRCLGADSDDGIRGLGFDFVVADEFADWDQSVLPMVVMPTLAGRNGGLFIIGTPKGVDALTDMYDKHKASPDWFTAKFSVNDTKVLPESELEIMRSAMTDQQYKLEMLCDFDAGAPGQLIAGSLVKEAMERSYQPEQYSHEARIMACDIARQGDDRSVIAKRQGLQLWEPLSWQSANLMESVRIIADEYRGYKPDALFIDGGGIGAGVVDALRDLGIPVIEVQFGSKASDPRFINLRAEMWVNMYHWLRRGGRLPPDVELKAELTGPNHFTNDKGQTQLEAKEDLKKRGLRSPDKADAVAMTFAMPVHPQKQTVAPEMKPKSDWEPF